VPEILTKILDLPTFLRMFQMRKSQIMWFLGAGASRAAGVKAAGDMIWEFKRKLYCSEKKRPLSVVADLADSNVRRQLQSHFDAKGAFPVENAEDEYAAYFEATYPSPQDRRTFIEGEIKSGKPSFGHYALALLMQKGLCRIVWTTNFDRTVEDAAFKVLGGSGALIVADLAEPRKIRQAWAEQRWPTYGKLHGDYQSERLKNVADELREQDAEMRRCLIEGCRGHGLAVIGYSGRDASIRAALQDAIRETGTFPGGLFWFKRHQDELYDGVKQLILTAQEKGLDAHVVEVETFDELFADITRFLPETEKEIGQLVDVGRPRLAKVSSRQRASNIPAIRSNALPIVSYPAICRLVVCEIGGSDDVHEAIAKVGVDVLAMRARVGVLCFGRDVDVRKAFEPYRITAFETHAIAPAQLVAATGTRALLRDALFRCVSQQTSLTSKQRGRSRGLLPAPGIVKPADFNSSDTKPIDRLAGTIGTISWEEACALRLDFKMNALWLLLEPRVILDVPEAASPADIERAREFVRERGARRRNRETNALLDGWTRLIVGSDQSVRLRAFNIADGHDAEFEIFRIAGFSGASA
jgi:hypothetical protein